MARLGFAGTVQGCEGGIHARSPQGLLQAEDAGPRPALVGSEGWVGSSGRAAGLQ